MDLGKIERYFHFLFKCSAENEKKHTEEDLVDVEYFCIFIEN